MSNNLSDKEFELLNSKKNFISILRKLDIISYSMYESYMQDIIIQMLRGSIDEIQKRVMHKRGLTGSYDPPLSDSDSV